MDFFLLLHILHMRTHTLGPFHTWVFFLFFSLMQEFEKSVQAEQDLELWVKHVLVPETYDGHGTAKPSVFIKADSEELSHKIQEIMDDRGGMFEVCDCVTSLTTTAPSH
jgi:hypothetical protein